MFTALCSWVFWFSLLGIGAFILGWLFRTPKIDEWKNKYEGELSNNSSFKKKYDKMEKASKGYSKDLEKFEHTIGKQKSEISALKASTTKWERDHRAVAAEKASLSTKLGLLNSEITGLKSNEPVVVTDENEKEVDRLTDILHQRDSEIERLRSDVSEVRSEKDEYIRRSESYKPRFEEANLERNTLRVKYDKLIAAQTGASNDNQSMASENTSLKDEVTKLRAELENAQGSSSTADERVNAEKELAAKAVSEKNDLQVKYEALLRHQEQLEAIAKETKPDTSASDEWKSKYDALAAEKPQWEAKYNTANTALLALQNAPAPVATDEFKSKWEALNQEKPEWVSKHNALNAENERLKMELARAKEASAAAPIQAFAAAPVVDTADDDLKKVEGIGPKIEELIKADGIKSWAALSNTNVDRLKRILTDAGSRFQMHDPASWPLQAGMAARGEWEALEKWQDEHDNGKM